MISAASDLRKTASGILGDNHHRIGRFLAGALLVVFVAMACSSMARKSATWDETVYLGLGAYLFDNLKWDIPSISAHPPLPYYLSSLPLAFCDLDQSCYKKGEVWHIGSGIIRGNCLLRNSRPSGDRLLFLARLPIICLGILLGCFVYRWALQIFGIGGALLALFLYCLSPNILAHVRLITPDFSLSTFGFIATYYFWKNTRKASIKNTILSGCFLGLALLSKYSALIWVPTLALLALASGLIDPLKPFHPLRISLSKRRIIDFGIILGVAAFVILIGYGFQAHPYLAGIQLEEREVGEGFPAFLNGSVSSKGGWWYYYLLAFLMKVPIPALILIAGSFIFWRWIRSIDWFTALCLLLPVFMFLTAFSSFTKVNIGLRYVLPAFPFLMVFPGILTTLRPRKSRLCFVMVAPLLVWYAYESLSIHPHYLAYFNQFVGGARNGYCHLVDSNLDWGQDLKGLKSYMDRNGIERIKLSYFGTADPVQYKIDFDALPSFVIYDPPSVCRRVKKGDIVAISATNLYRLYVDLGRLGEHLGKSSPIDHVGHSILIYRLGSS